MGRLSSYDVNFDRIEEPGKVIYQVDDILRGYNTHGDDKILPIWNSLTPHFGTLLKETEPTITLHKDSRTAHSWSAGTGNPIGSYGLQLFQNPSGIVLVELFGRHNGYTGRNIKLSEINPNFLAVTLFPSQKNLEAVIEESMNTYPRKSEKVTA